MGGGDHSVPCRYAAFVTAADGYEIRPLSYGMKLFQLGARGKLVPVVRSGEHDPRLAAFATIDDDNTVAVTLINKVHGSDAKPVDVHVTLKTTSPAIEARSLLLSAPPQNIATTSGITLGGAAILPDGSWLRSTNPVGISADGSVVTVSLRPASAMLVIVRTR